LTTPPPSVSIGSPPIGTPTMANGQSHQTITTSGTTPLYVAGQSQQTWNHNNNNNNHWPSDATTTPTSSCGSPDGHWNRSYGSQGTPHTWNTSSGGSGSAEKPESKRGRPRSEALTTLMVEGSISPSSIKCHYCNRVFPREKSLQAHLRTHTGERPYQCDYPGCKRAFTQSGQLKTHQRLHTGERPFICSVAHCQMRFTHANRHCPDHPLETLKRCDDFVIQALPEQNTEVLKWLEKYRAEREDRTPTRKTPIKRTNSPDGVGNTAQRSATNNENHLPLGLLASPVTPNNTYKSIRKGLMDMNACMGLTSPVTTKAKNSLPKLIQWQEPTSQEENESGDECCVPSKQSTFNPKKKWLRDAWQEDLAKPLEPNLISPKLFASTTSTMALKQQLHQERIGHSTSAPAPVVTSVAPPPPVPFNPNQTRPTVLMVASKDSARPLSVKPAAELLANEITANGTCLSPKPEENNRKLQGALALMQLAAKDA
ncbi:AGAP010516-PA, partial [Anopheles gambiae str. PEST]